MINDWLELARMFRVGKCVAFRNSISGIRNETAAVEIKEGENVLLG
jgi:hypothetical protein